MEFAQVEAPLTIPTGPATVLALLLFSHEKQQHDSTATVRIYAVHCWAVSTVWMTGPHIKATVVLCRCDALILELDHTTRAERRI